MIATMPDYDRIDRELAAIGPVPESLAGLVERYGPRDRSLDEVDQVLSVLRAGRSSPGGASTPAPERPSFLPLGWDAGRKSEPPEPRDPAPPPAPVAQPVGLDARDDITETSSLPSEVMAEPEPSQPEVREQELSVDVAPAGVAAASAGGDPFDTLTGVGPVVASQPPAASADEIEEVSASSEPQRTFGVPEGLAPPVEPAATSTAEADAAGASALSPEAFERGDDMHPPPRSRSSLPPRPDLQALLDEELDPREFPSVPPPANPPANPPASSSLPASPPPLLPRSSRPPVIEAAPGEAEDEADFELLVDDDDILEIDE